VEALEVLRELRGIAKEDRLIKCVHTTTSHYYYEMALLKRNNNNDPFRSSQSAHLLSSLQVTLFGPDTLVLITFRLAGKPTGVFILGPESTHPMPYDSIRRSLPFSKLGERASYIGLPSSMGNPRLARSLDIAVTIQTTVAMGVLPMRNAHTAFEARVYPILCHRACVVDTCSILPLRRVQEVL
jgi:hypothetical protein